LYLNYGWFIDKGYTLLNTFTNYQRPVCLAPALGVTEYIFVGDMILVTLHYLTQNLMFNNPRPSSRSALMLHAEDDERRLG